MQVVGEILNALLENGHPGKYSFELVLGTRHGSHEFAEEGEDECRSRSSKVANGLSVHILHGRFRVYLRVHVSPGGIVVAGMRPAERGGAVEIYPLYLLLLGRGALGVDEREEAELGGVDVADEVAEVAVEDGVGKGAGGEGAAGGVVGEGGDVLGVAGEDVDVISERPHCGMIQRPNTAARLLAVPFHYSIPHPCGSLCRSSSTAMLSTL